MRSIAASAFDLPEIRARKADPALIGVDEEHFAAIAHALEHTVSDLTDRLAAALRSPGGGGQEAMERDQEVHRLTARLRLVRRYGVDLCLGRMVRAGTDTASRGAARTGDPTAGDGDIDRGDVDSGGIDSGGIDSGDIDGDIYGGVIYVGRMGLLGPDGERLLVDWRAPAAEPFFGATHANPMGLVSRRRYHWARGRVTDYWDEVFQMSAGAAGHPPAALDDQSAFIASLAATRTPRMRDVLATIAADQDAIIRAGSPGSLVVDGGPGTGKTVVALHRAAYLMYADRRVSQHRGGVLVVGPHQPYLSYVSDVLPSLGEDSVQLCTLSDMVPEGPMAGAEPDRRVAQLKSSSAMVAAVEPAVAFYEEPPTNSLVVETPWQDLHLDADDWSEAFRAPDPGTPHNEARDAIIDRLLEILQDQADSLVPVDALRRSLRSNGDLVTAVSRAWPLIDHATLVGDLWSVPAYLRRCAPWLDSDEIRLLQRRDPRAWTDADLPLLDAARRRLGDPDAARRRRQRERAANADRGRMDRVIEEAIAADDSEMQVMSMLRGADLRSALLDPDALPAPDPDRLAGPFAHIVVDEAQELTDAQWQMLVARCPSGSMTVVGDRAQARRGFTESWRQRLERVGLGAVALSTLGINYRTPSEVMAEAEPVIRLAIPDANVPTSIRSTGIPVEHAPVPALVQVLRSWLAENAEGTACVVTARPENIVGVPRDSRVSVLSPQRCKGLEFDLVVLVDPHRFGDDGPAGSIERAVDRYVAMTRATRRLVILTDPATASPPVKSTCACERPDTTPR